MCRHEGVARIMRQANEALMKLRHGTSGGQGLLSLPGVAMAPGTI